MGCQEWLQAHCNGQWTGVARAVCWWRSKARPPEEFTWFQELHPILPAALRPYNDSGRRLGRGAGNLWQSVADSSQWRCCAGAQESAAGEGRPLVQQPRGSAQQNSAASLCHGSKDGQLC